jgi:hypothetical protein
VAFRAGRGPLFGLHNGSVDDEDGDDFTERPSRRFGSYVLNFIFLAGPVVSVEEL